MRAVIRPPSRLKLLTALALAAMVLILSACQPERATMAQAPLDTPPTVTPSSTIPVAYPTPVPPSSTPSILATPGPTTTSTNPPTAQTRLSPTLPRVTATLALEPTPKPASPSPTPRTVEPARLPAEEWKLWPVIPQVPISARLLYQQGLASGNDPHTFSILGDCQSLAETFLGVYDTDPALVASLPTELQTVVAQFAGSFNRQSPTIKGGTTAGAVLWDAWHENKFTCQVGESPLDCELRLHKPSIVIINLGTHYETRNITYLRKILDELTVRGIIPILTTKADNRELDERLNQEMALLAVEYDVPLWNFWAAVSDLPNHAVGVKEGEEFLGEIYLSEEGLERHRYTALQALAKVWQGVK